MLQHNAVDKKKHKLKTALPIKEIKMKLNSRPMTAEAMTDCLQSFCGTPVLGWLPDSQKVTGCSL